MTANTPRPHEVEVIKRGLEVVLRGGVRPAWLVHCHELLELTYVRGEAGSQADDPYARAFVLERLLLDALAALGSGPVGNAARLLFGVSPETRGRLLKDRRRLAAGELDLMPSSFRRCHEDSIVDDLSLEVWRTTSRRSQDRPR